MLWIVMTLLLSMATTTNVWQQGDVAERAIVVIGSPHVELCGVNSDLVFARGKQFHSLTCHAWACTIKAIMQKVPLAHICWFYDACQRESLLKFQDYVCDPS